MVSVMLDRLELLVGNKINNIINKHVLIIGLGGVGGYALESLVRCGISEVTIVDGDTVNESNLNRQLVATIKTIGLYKTDAFEKRLLDINPNIKINKITKFITSEEIDKLFINNIDYVIDCCDTISVKEELIRYCTNNDINLISCMGTGNKMHPEKLNIMKLKNTSYDPIAKRLRKFVKDNNIKKDIYVVCSDEEKYQKEKTTAIPSNSFVPATAGLLCTSYVINDILK